MPGVGMSGALYCSIDIWPYLSLQLNWGKGDDHARLDDASLHTPNWHCANASNFINILQGQTKRLVSWTRRGYNRVQSLKQSGSTSFSFLALHVPSLLNRIERK